MPRRSVDLSNLRAFPVRGNWRYTPATYYSLRSGGSRVHQGHDILGRIGTPIVSTTNGVIDKVFNRAAREGNGVIVVDDMGRRHGYFHFRDPVQLREGQSVRAGDVLGVLGMSGSAVGPHLHYQIADTSGRRINASTRLLALAEGERQAGILPSMASLNQLQSA